MSLFTQLNQLLATGERINLQLSKEKDGKIAVLIQPILQREPEGLTEELAALRAALTIPLRVVDNPEALDGAALLKIVAQYQARRSEIADDYSALSQLNEAAKAAKQQKAKTPTPPPAATKPAEADAVPEPTPAPAVDTATNPECLI